MTEIERALRYYGKFIAPSHIGELITNAADAIAERDKEIEELKNKIIQLETEKANEHLNKIPRDQWEDAARFI